MQSRPIEISFLLLIILCFTRSLCGQTLFEPGYFISNNGQVFKCLIRNEGWKDNPTGFDYKLTGNDTITKGTIETVREFGLENGTIFIRFTGDIDRSSEVIARLSHSRNPVWSQETLYLKVLEKGRATLYRYNEYEMTRFFYSKGDSAPQQLVYKSYLYDQLYIGYNKYFQQQLWNDVRVRNITQEKLSTLDYDDEELLKYFKTYNDTTANVSALKYKSKYKTHFHLIITPGINYSSFYTFNSYHQVTTEFDDQFGFQIGLNAELILPLNKNKWGIEFEPTYQYFISTAESNPSTVTIKYYSIDFPVGIRYFCLLNDHLKLFFDGFIILPFRLNMNSTVSTDDYSMNITSGVNFIAGTGISYKAFSAEFRYYTREEILNDYLFITSNYHRFAFILGLKIF
jgi:hypothetical protein